MNQAKRRAISACLLLTALSGCTLPVAFQGFGVFARGKTSVADPGVGSVTPAPDTGAFLPGGAGTLSLSGTVTLDDRASFDGIDVQLSKGGKSIAKKTDGAGGFRFEKLTSGAYSLTASKAGYGAVQSSFSLEGTQTLPAIVLSSPIDSITLDAGDKTVYLPPTDPTDLAVYPSVLPVAATVRKQNGDSVGAVPGMIDWLSSDPGAASVDGGGVVRAEANLGAVTISAAAHGVSGVSASVRIEVKDPGSQVDFRVLSLGGSR